MRQECKDQSATGEASSGLMGLKDEQHLGAAAAQGGSSLHRGAHIRAIRNDSVATIQALLALAPDLVDQPFRSIRGGIRLCGSGLDVIINPEVAGLLQGSRSLARRARETGRSVLVMAILQQGLGIICDGAIKNDPAQLPSCFGGWRPWVDPIGEGLWLSPARDDQPGALHIQRDGLSWHRTLPAIDMGHLLDGRDCVDDRIATICRQQELQL